MTAPPMPQPRPLIAIELFSGAGGMSLGFEAAGFDILVAIDNNPIHVATHQWNFPNTKALCADVGSLSTEDILTAAKTRWAEQFPASSWPDGIDLVFGGPSCQGFSEIGRRNPADERNNLLPAFARLVAEVKPRYFVMENVPGLLSPINTTLLRETLAMFSAAGYRLSSDGPLMLNASNFGVPQLRRRVFIVGSRADMRPVTIRNIETMDKVTVAEALDDLKCLERYRTLSIVDSVRMSPSAMSRLESKASQYVQCLRYGGDRFSGSYGLGYGRPWDPAVVTSCGRAIHRADVAERFRRTSEGAEELISRLPRLRSDGQAPTLRAGTGPDHGSFTSARPIHHIYPRVITVREAARLHSFPDWFGFHLTKWHAFQQIGNSVPPFLARAVAGSIIEAMQVEPRNITALFEDRDDELLLLSPREAAERFDMDPELLPKDSRIRKKAPDPV
jgi:DNA (cytosine-5)-methyltransferase 1